MCIPNQSGGLGPVSLLATSACWEIPIRPYPRASLFPYKASPSSVFVSLLLGKTEWLVYCSKLWIHSLCLLPFGFPLIKFHMGTFPVLAHCSSFRLSCWMAWMSQGGLETASWGSQGFAVIQEAGFPVKRQTIHLTFEFQANKYF